MRAVQEFIATRQGYRLATSPGSVLTGLGADLILIDDPLKPEEALSVTQRQAANGGSITPSRELGQEAVARVFLTMRPRCGETRREGLGGRSGHHVADGLLYLRLCRAVLDFDKAHPCPFEGNALDTITPFCGAADIMPGPLVFENRYRVSVQVGNQEVVSFAIDRPVCVLGLPAQSQGRIRSDDLPKAHLRKHVKRIGAARTRLPGNIQGRAEHVKLPSPHNPDCREFEVAPVS